jgi:hypothetical protein
LTPGGAKVNEKRRKEKGEMRKKKGEDVKKKTPLTAHPLLPLQGD